MKNKLIIIRGPAAIGKTTITKRLAKKIKAEFIILDKIMKENKMDYIKGDKWIPLKKYLRSNETLIPRLKKSLKNNKVIIEQNFYHKKHLFGLITQFPNSIVFTLKASLKTCINRNNQRKGRLTKESIIAVYKLVNKFDHGMIIDTNNKSKDEVIKEILKHINNHLTSEL